MTSNLRQAWGRKAGSCEEGGGEPSAVLAQGVGLVAKLMESLHILGPDEKTLSPIQRGLRNGPVKGHLSEEQKTALILMPGIRTLEERLLLRFGRKEAGETITSKHLHW